MKVIVLHGEYDIRGDNIFDLIDHQPVAEFDFSGEADSIDEALDLAYRHTNNIEDSWSRYQCDDAHRSLKLLKPLEFHNGRAFGHRSSMVGDLIVVYPDGANVGQVYKVAGFGFEKIENNA